MAEIVEVGKKLWRRGWLRWLRRRHLRLGRRGENAAVRLLLNLGYDILCRNCRWRNSEIDIVARDGLTLCFVEVKTRRRKNQEELWPAEAIDRAKRRTLNRAARKYWRDLGRPRIACRFDVIEVIVRRGRIDTIRHLPAAFALRLHPAAGADADAGRFGGEGADNP